MADADTLIEVLAGTDVAVVEVTTVLDPVVIEFFEAGPSNLYVQQTQPATTQSSLWIQTGLGDDGHDFTFWVEDGLG